MPGGAEHTITKKKTRWKPKKTRLTWLLGPERKRREELQIAEAGLVVAKTKLGSIERVEAFCALKIIESIINTKEGAYSLDSLKETKFMTRELDKQLGVNIEKFKTMIPTLVERTGLVIKVGWRCMCRPCVSSHCDYTCGNYVLVSW